MAISNVKATLQVDIERVWEIVTSLYDYSWRSDLSKIEILEDGKILISCVSYKKDTVIFNNYCSCPISKPIIFLCKTTIIFHNCYTSTNYIF